MNYTNFPYQPMDIDKWSIIKSKVSTLLTTRLLEAVQPPSVILTKCVVKKGLQTYI